MVEVLTLLPEEDQMDTTITITDRQAEAKERRNTLLSALPDEFSTKMAIEEGEKQGVPRKTLDNWLVKWQKEDIIQRTSQGVYRKIPTQQ